ncbi:PilZ domain-containing protein [Pseudodesulfovibrio sp. zrk46]|uniref:PilZ domain-containing protein n=1 Tax=Pseudodesulfovibrio sp. zrk46 TaxID=2725288 RepID=UPI001448D4A0|nr:PilZ domain-containing protein [Pseudodesulfovibrio sp. zrk46]QJB57968.1 flagellar brake protein [Pseudodesulfovibrio sp. zrk46]
MIDLAAGDKVLIEFSTFGDRFLSIVTDVKKNGHLMIYSPITPPVVERLRTDRSVLVRFAYEGSLQGFKSQVLSGGLEPNSIVEIAGPDDTFDAEERSEPRCSCRFPAVVVEGERAAEAVVEDMSASCSRVRFLNGGLAPFVQETDRDVRLTFHPFDVGDGYSVECVIRNAFIKNGERYAVLEFKPEEKDARARIADFVEAQVCCGIPRL